MAGTSYSMLFLSQRNSVRSLMAEALTNHLGQGRFTGVSAGHDPLPQNDPLALDVLRLAGIPSDGLHPKHWKEFVRPDRPSFDFVVALYDPDLEPLPQLPGAPMTALWRYPDPRVTNEDLWKRRRAYGGILSGLERQLRIFMQLPFASLDRMSLQDKFSEIGQGST
jgi:arsenate reductase (thioredoxin)